MSLSAVYQDARRGEQAARLSRYLALRAMVASGMSQRQIAQRLGITQPAVSQQLAASPAMDKIQPEALMEAAAPVLRVLAADNGFTRLAVFGSVARHEARPDSDIDMLVQAPPGTSSFTFIRFKGLIEQILGRQIDLVSYGSLKTGIDNDILREAVLL